ncbi:Colicin I receptor precursor [Bacteroidales bacterium Barb6]|nr:Colicin I receptor precursor [Bacteroidales bacterium Barb6]
MGKILFSLLPLVLLVFGVQAQTDSVALIEYPHALGEVVVTGQYEPQSLRNSVFQVRTVSKEVLRQKAATDVITVLNTELGFRFSNDMALGETDVQMMGMSGQNVKVLLDGVPLIDRGGTKQSLGQIDINTIERIELVEGPMSVVYGTDALAGVINLITKKQTAANGHPLAVGVRVQEESAGHEYRPATGNGVHNESLNLNYQHASGFTAGGSFSRNAFGGWQGAYTGRDKEWKPKDQFLAGGSLGYKAEKWNIRYRLNYLNETIFGLGDINAKHIAQNRNYLTDRYTHILQSEGRFNSAWSAGFSATYQDYSRQTQTTQFNTETGERRKTAGQGEQDLSAFQTAFARATVQYKPSSVWAFQGGAEYRSDKGSGDRIDSTQHIADYSLFLSMEIKPLTWLNLRPGVRFSRNSVYDAPPVIPSVNALFNVRPDMDVRLAYARGFRAPALRELYFKFVDSNHRIFGNTDLEAEYSNSLTGSLTWRIIEKDKMRYTAVFSGFYNRYNNLIATAIDAGNTDNYTYINIDKFRTVGGIWENTLIWRQLRASLGLSYIGRYNLYAEDEPYEADNLPSFNWSPEINGNVSYRFSKIGLDMSLYCKYTGIKPVFQSDGDGNVSKAQTNAFTWLDITAGKTLWKYWTLNAGIKNIFDVTKIKNNSAGSGAHSTSGDLPMSYGRSWFAGIGYQW